MQALMLLLLCLSPADVVKGDLSSCEVMQIDVVQIGPDAREEGVSKPGCDAEKGECS